MVDMDGTLAHMTGRSPFEWHRVGEDKLDQIIANITRHYKYVVIMSGRDEVCRPETEKWLRKHDIRYDSLVMRVANDNRPDEIVKLELYKQHVEPNYSIEFVLDDRNKVVKMWRDNGLKCLQVADGDF
jgi:hypothetical protein